MTSVALIRTVTWSPSASSSASALPRDRGDDRLAADVDGDLGHDRAELDARDGAGELVARAELHVGSPFSTLFVARAMATTRVPVALNDAYADTPTWSPRRCKDSAVISAVSGPIEERARLPSYAIPRTGPSTTLIAEPFEGVVEIVMSQG
jgi:hypothetical protein